MPHLFPGGINAKGEPFPAAGFEAAFGEKPAELRKRLQVVGRYGALVGKLPPGPRSWSVGIHGGLICVRSNSSQKMRGGQFRCVFGAWRGP